MEKDILVITEGFHPPWTEGSINILLSWLASLAMNISFKGVIITWKDPKRAYIYEDMKKLKLTLGPSSYLWIYYVEILQKLRELPLLLRAPIKLDLWRTLVNQYLRFTSLIQVLRALQKIKGLLTDNQYDPVIIMHNVGTYMLTKLLKHVDTQRLNILVTNTFADYTRVMGLLHILASRNVQRGYIITSSPFTWYIANKIETELTGSKLKLLSPIPILGSVVEKLGIRHIFRKNDKAEDKIVHELLNNFINRYTHIVLYIGELNEARFPISLLLHLCKSLRAVDGGLLVVTPPSYSTLRHIKLIKNIGLPNNLHILPIPIDPWLKERILELASIVVSPNVSPESYTVVDPPLFIVESMFKGKFIVAFSNSYIRALFRHFKYESQVLVPNGDINKFIYVLLNILKKSASEYPLRSSSNVTEPITVGRELVNLMDQL